MTSITKSTETLLKTIIIKLVSLFVCDRPSPRPRGSARRKTASSLILRGHF